MPASNNTPIGIPTPKPIFAPVDSPPFASVTFSGGAFEEVAGDGADLDDVDEVEGGEVELEGGVVVEDMLSSCPIVAGKVNRAVTFEQQSLLPKPALQHHVLPEQDCIGALSDESPPRCYIRQSCMLIDKEQREIKAYTSIQTDIQAVW